ncbi:uncharacterized protein LOC118377294 isoform X4 [Oncorhynchus keta]|uniref:uncharacterized protein LOC118377294 isoform X4 n=1 Tax=Oncorhynchus keta TaxID=8018 RepID=UPI0015F9B857|nr:uncharacterized protein LOC118377294 isoform X4 [Oncorhynchus keta]
MAVAVYEETECRKNCPAQDTNLPPETSSALESGTSISSSREVLPAPPTAILENIHESGEINLNLAEGGKGEGSVERVFTGDEDTSGIVKELSWNSGDCDKEERRDAFSEGVSDIVSAGWREGDCFVPVGVEVTEMAAEGEFEDGMRAEMKEGKGTNSYESGEELVAERAVKREIEEKDTEGKLVLEKEHKVAPKRKNIRKRRRSTKPQRDKEANSSASFVETVLSLLLSVFLWLQAFSPTMLSWSPNSLFCIVMLGVASGTGGVFTSNDHQSLSCIACKIPGCAADVTKIWCGEDELLKGLPIPLCTSISQKSKTVCQHDGRTFVLMIEEGKKCDMEQYHDHVPSEKTECPPLLEAAQDSRLDTVRGDTTLSAPTLNADMTTSPPPENGFIGVVVAVYLIRQKKQGASRNQDEETEMSALNNGINQNGGPANRDKNEEVAVNMLDNGGPLSHRQ